MSDEIMSTEDILAAYKRKKAQAQTGAPDAPDAAIDQSQSKEPVDGPSGAPKPSTSPYEPAEAQHQTTEEPAEAVAPEVPPVTPPAPMNAQNNGDSNWHDAAESMETDAAASTQPNVVDDEPPQPNDAEAEAPQPITESTTPPSVDASDALPAVGQGVGANAIQVQARDPSAMMSLSPAAGALGLADTLRQDANATVRGGGGLRMLAVLSAIIGGIVLTADRYIASLGSNLVLGGIVPALYLAAALLSLAVLSFAASLILGRKQQLIKFKATQAEELAATRAKVQTYASLQIIGYIACAAGPMLGAVVLYLLGSGGLLIAGGLIFIGILGLVVGIFAQAIKTVAKRTYVQASLLAFLEEHGPPGQAGAMDESVPRVLSALDTLLGELPESAVREFLVTNEAQEYLALMDKVRQA